MPCTNPVGIADKQGDATKRPCGTCIDCRLDYSKQWAIRCYHEAFMNEENSFLTLTYNNEHLPKDGSVSKMELQNFMKRLRKKIKTPVRFFASSEYGAAYDRPHYHICLFGFDFPDKEVFRAKCRSKGYSHMLYISKMLGQIWQKGYHTIGELNFETAAYTARYITKKHMGKNSDFVYDGLEPEFALMSRGQKKGGKGGIGKPWFDKFWNDVFPKDFVTINGKKHKPPKFYDNLMEKKNLKMWQYIKAKRQWKAFLEEPETSKRQWHKDRYRKQLVKRLERTLENA